MDQICLPMDLEEDIPPNHLVRVVNTAVNRLDDGIFASAYSGGGRDSYHPKLLTKVIVYAYTQRIYSSRQIAKAVRENVMFMWIAGRQRPDFRTINRFRSERMKEVLEKVFTAILQFLKEDHMRNGQLKPGYNVQIGTENQFIVGYSLHQRPTDTRCLKPHLEKLKASLGKLPHTVIADAGYGGEENYAYLESEQVEAVVKYGTYHKDKSKKWKNDISKIDNWTYFESRDEWICSAGHPLTFRYETQAKTDSGYTVQQRIYRSEHCMDCPLKSSCTKAKGNREIHVSLPYLRYKQQVREKLRSDEGYELAVRRMIEPGSVFGQMKNNRGFRRFLLRGLSKVNLEVGWLSLAHNLLKKAVIDQKTKTVGVG